MSSYFTDQKMKNYAAFGNVEFDVNDQVKLKGGISQTKAKRWSEAFNGDLPQYPILPSDQTFAGTPGVTLTNFFNTLYGALSGLYGGPGSQIPTIATGGSLVLDRPEERRVGKGCVRTCRSRRSPSPHKKK